jgi:hypothetical protein
MGKKGTTRFTKEEFNQIKTMNNEFGLSAKQIMSVTGRSSGTMSRVLSSNTWEDYRELIMQSNKKHYGPKNDAVTKAPQRTHLSEDSVNLERIASALERLALAWEAHPQTTKRSIFTKG